MKILKNNPIIYVTRDIERALGIKPQEGYFVIANYSKFASKVAKDNENILLIKKDKILDTRELLEQKEVVEFINKKNASVVVFKNTSLIEKICNKNNWKLLNPSARLADIVEAKISQVEWLGELKKYLPEHNIKVCGDIEFGEMNERFLRSGRNDKGNEKFILQFNHSHSGEGTVLISSEKDLEKIKNKFPKREARITKYIKGISFTNNNVVTKDDILIGGINYQITGLEPFTNLEFATVGNDWGVVKDILDKEQIIEYKKIAKEVGKKLQKDGWRGAYGIDIVAEEDTKKLFLIEINARQPASTSYESQLQREIGGDIATFEAHLLALLDLSVDEDLLELKNGSQILLKNNDLNTDLNHCLIENLEKEGLKVIEYENKKKNSDLLRMQSRESIMEGHKEFSELGRKVIKTL